MSTPSIPHLPSGTRVREFELLRRISDGGQGDAYLARIWDAAHPSAHAVVKLVDTGLRASEIAQHQLCVVKIPHPASSDNLVDEHAFLSEPAIVHPRVVQLFRTPGEQVAPRANVEPGLRYATFNAEDGQVIVENYPCLIVEYHAGGSLRDLLRLHGHEPLPTGAAVLIARQIAEALDHLHTVAAIVHHDVSPSNVVLRERLPWDSTADPDCSLLDFAAADSLRKTRKREVLAKTRYCAPERRVSRANMTIAPPPDIYSLGVVLYEMLVGSSSVRTEQVVAHTFPPLRERNSAYSPAIEELVQAMTALNPLDRPSAREVIVQLDALPERVLPTALRGPAPPGATARRLTRPQFIRLAVGALVVALALGLGSASVVPMISPNPTTTPTSEPTVTPLASPSPRAITATPLRPTSTPAASVPRP